MPITTDKDLKDNVRALWLKALGHSYEQICEATGWTLPDGLLPSTANKCLLHNTSP